MVTTMMSTIDKNSDLKFVKKLHGFTHASSYEMKNLISDAGIMTAALEKLCDKVFEPCPICSSSGRPAHRKKISIFHVNEAFNVEIKANFMLVHLDGTELYVLKIVDLGTNYGESAITPARNAEIMMRMF